jgi:hypothetical protein
MINVLDESRGLIIRRVHRFCPSPFVASNSIHWVKRNCMFHNREIMWGNNVRLLTINVKTIVCLPHLHLHSTFFPLRITDMPFRQGPTPLPLARMTQRSRPWMYSGGQQPVSSRRIMEGLVTSVGQVGEGEIGRILDLDRSGFIVPTKVQEVNCL